MTHRIILTGKNSAFPKTVRMPLGYGVDGSVITKRIQIRADECICPVCHGHGELRENSINPSERARYYRCTACDDGIAKVAA